MLALLLLAGSFAPFARAAGAPPNIVLMLADNLGYGELGVYGGGILRGAPTPRLDGLAAGGLRLLNFNVENQCTPTRSALLTGRIPLRSGTGRVPLPGQPRGLVQWEVTLAEVLSGLGYTTGHFGKWHLGDRDGRWPTDQGFDEWYGIANSTDEALYTSVPDFAGSGSPAPQILEGGRGQPARAVATYDIETRRTIDAEVVRRAIDFMQRSVRAGKPFFTYVPFIHVHWPTLPHPDFDGRTGHGDFADALAELDHRAGQILDALDALGAGANTIVIFASDNGPEFMSNPEWHGTAGYWRGSYITALEGSLRVPFMVRWPGRIAPGRISNDIVHAVDVLPTLASLAGGAPPADRAIDGLDQSAFLRGTTPRSAREGFPVFINERLYAVKWRDWKVHYVGMDDPRAGSVELPLPRVYNLVVDPRESTDVFGDNVWVMAPATRIVDDFNRSLEQDPPIPAGTPDPWPPTTGRPGRN